MTFSLNINPVRKLHPVSPTLFGIFFEDISYACDGGLNANLVNNFSFDGIYLDPKGLSSWERRFAKPEPRQVIDRLRYWTMAGGTLESRRDDPAAENSWYARIQVDGGAGDGVCRLENLGYNGKKAHSADCAISIQAGQDYNFSCWARSQDFQGTVTIVIVDASGAALTPCARLTPTGAWQQYTFTLFGESSGYGKLVIDFNGRGALDLDGISLMSADTWGRGDPKWSQGRLRRDLVEVLRDLHPRFMRFPGGCIVEGHHPGNEYNWKETVGPVLNRKTKYNLWAANTADGGYNQSNQVGFYEYFLLCEDLGMQPLPIVFAGINCQLRSEHFIETHSPQFQEQVVQNVLDLIEYANGDPHTNPWAALRAAAGHPAPFDLKYIGIGNENFGDDYLEKFAAIKQAIDALYPGMVCVLTAGVAPEGQPLEELWAKVHERFRDVLVDEHNFARPEWFIQAHCRYDSYRRDSAKVYMGEYAANFPYNAPTLSVKANSYQTALGEAVFLAGLERNSDVVAMSSYAPLFSLVDGETWVHNLINFNPAHVLLTANYFVQKMYSTTVGDHVVEMQGELPEGVFASATSTLERVIVKLVNTNPTPIQAQLQLAGVSDGAVQVEYLQSDDQNAANVLTFHGMPEYSIQPKALELTVENGEVKLDLAPYGFYVLIATR